MYTDICILLYIFTCIYVCMKVLDPAYAHCARACAHLRRQSWQMYVHIHDMFVCIYKFMNVCVPACACGAGAFIYLGRQPSQRYVVHIVCIYVYMCIRMHRFVYTNIHTYNRIINIYLHIYIHTICDVRAVVHLGRQPSQGCVLTHSMHICIHVYTNVYDPTGACCARTHIRLGRHPWQAYVHIFAHIYILYTCIYIMYICMYI